MALWQIGLLRAAARIATIFYSKSKVESWRLFQAPSLRRRPSQAWSPRCSDRKSFRLGVGPDLQKSPAGVRRWQYLAIEAGTGLRTERPLRVEGGPSCAVQKLAAVGGLPTFVGTVCGALERGLTPSD